MGSHSGSGGGDNGSAVRIIVAAAAIAFALSIFLTMLVATRTLPLVDGWYEALIYLKSRGLLPYRDIEFLLPPMTPLFYSVMNAIAGENLAWHKIIGVVLSVVNAGLIFLWLRRENGRAESFITAFVAFLLETTFPTYLPRDYHSLVTAFAVPCLIAMMSRSFGEEALTRRALLRSGLAGGAAQLLFLTKQSTGLLVFLAFAAFLLCAGLIQASAQRSLRALASKSLYLGAFLGGFVATGVVFLSLYHTGLPTITFYQQLLSIESKGTPLYAATRIFHDENNARILAAAFAHAIWLSLLLQGLWYLKERCYPHLQKYPSSALDGARFVLFGGAMALGWTVIIQRQGTWVEFDYLATLGITFYFLDAFWQIKTLADGRRLDFEALARLMLFGALIVANTLTASINSVGTGLVLAYYLALLLGATLRWLAQAEPAWSRAATFGLVLAVCLVTVRLEELKLVHPYAWWGIAEPPVFDSDTAPAEGALRGLTLDRRRVAVIDSIVSEIKSATMPSDAILAYPNIPLFYMLSGRMPMTHSYIQWFDFARSKTLVADFEKVSDSPPKVVVEMAMPPVIYNGHSELIGQRLPQRAFTDYLNCMVERGAFDVLGTYAYTLEGTYRVDIDSMASAEELARLAAIATRQGANVRVRGTRLDDVDITLETLSRSPQPSAKLYSNALVEGDAKDIDALVATWTAETGLRFALRSVAVIRVLKRTAMWKDNGAACRDTLWQRLED